MSVCGIPEVQLSFLHEIIIERILMTKIIFFLLNVRNAHYPCKILRTFDLQISQNLIQNFSKNEFQLSLFACKVVHLKSHAIFAIFEKHLHLCNKWAESNRVSIDDLIFKNIISLTSKLFSDYHLRTEIENSSISPPPNAKFIEEKFFVYLKRM